HVDLPGFMRAFTDDTSYARVRADFVEQVRPLVAAGGEGIIRPGACPCCWLRADAPSLFTAGWLFTASRGWRRAARGRVGCVASPARWSAAAEPTPRHRLPAWRSTSQGAGESARPIPTR